MPLLSTNYMMKIISLIFVDSPVAGGPRAKPYIYQVHLFQIIKAISKQLVKRQKSASKEIVCNILFALEHQIKRLMT